MVYKYKQPADLLKWRAMYFDIWKREWPYDDHLLRELVVEAPSRRDLMSLMRECHSFEPIK